MGGSADFDFLFGEWDVSNRKLADPLALSGEWLEFASTAQTRPVLGGLGNIDTYSAPSFPNRPGFEGFALRLFDHEHELWRIWWASTIGGGVLEPPVSGAFNQGEGRFEGDDVFAGRDVRVRFDWTDITETSARWEQAFSFDGGTSFETNWIMQLTREIG
jgi:hypothetical protein